MLQQDITWYLVGSAGNANALPDAQIQIGDFPLGQCNSLMGLFATRRTVLIVLARLFDILLRHDLSSGTKLMLHATAIDNGCS